MLHLALNTYVHLLFIVVIFCTLVVELLLVKKNLSYKSIRLLGKVDGFYGFAAIMVVITGLLNWMQFGKGYEYYANNSLFILKFSLFVVVGLLSIYPTVIFLRTRKRYKGDQPEVIDFTHYSTIRKVIFLELGIMCVIPLLAELMANGIDF